MISVYSAQYDPDRANLVEAEIKNRGIIYVGKPVELKSPCPEDGEEEEDEEAEGGDEDGNDEAEDDEGGDDEEN